MTKMAIMIADDKDGDDDEGKRSNEETVKDGNYEPLSSIG
jgi:hypothetical protein